MGATLQLQNDPFAFDKDANNQPEYAAEEFRSNMGALVAESYADQLTARSGVCGDRHYKITLSGTNVVAAGGQAIKGQNTGPVFFSNNGNVTVGALSPADPTNPRKDRVVLYQSGGHQIIEVIDGTAAASPSAPAVPSGALDLATITVPVSGTPTVTDNRVYTTALGGVQYVATTAEVAQSVPIGGLVYDAQAGSLKLRKSSGVVELQESNGIKAIAAGTGSIAPTAANTPTSLVIQFPSGRFTSAPSVTVSPITSAPGTYVTGMAVDNVTATSVKVWLTRTNTTSTGFYWIAVQA